jgi:hypothetical protein
MNDFVFMAIVDSTENLEHRLSCLLLTERLLLRYLIEELTTSAEFSHNEEESSVLVELIDLDDVRVVLKKNISSSRPIYQRLQDFHFLPQSLLVLWRGIVFRNDLDCTICVRDFVSGLANFSIGTLKCSHTPPEESCIPFPIGGFKSW